MSLLPSRAVAFLRRRTTFRAFKFYLEWLRRAVGLTTLVYLFAWFGIFLVSGLQFLTPLSKPLPFPLPIVVSVVLALSLLAPLVRSRVPPVTLNRRDLYRLGLAPVSPWLSLRWPLVQSWLLRAAIAIVLGLAWWVLAHTWLVRETPWAAIGLALIAVTHLNLGWLRYARGASRSTPFLGAASVALALVGIVIPDVGLGASLYSWGAGSLIVPAVFALVSSRVVYATLTQKYPPKFAAQCFVLSELQIVRTLNTLAAFSGTKGVSRVERTRLLEKLHDRAGRTPRQLPPPPSTAPAWRVLAWRTNLTLLRRSRLQGAATFIQLVFAGLALALVGQSLLALLLAVVVTGSVFSRLVGLSVTVGLLPISRRTRTLGRVVSGTGLASLVFALALGVAVSASVLGFPILGFSVSWVSLGAAVTFPPLALISLEKYATGLGATPERFEVWFVATLLALSPLFVLSVVGFAWLAAPIQLGLALLLLDLPV